jgi:tRNA dimethylallyltransferase
MPQIRTLLIAGPTASGKSALAVSIARLAGAAVVNADSMQVYAELSILTARPMPEEMVEVPHLLYGHVPAATAYSVGGWLDDMAGLLAGEAPLVIVGGTGLYFKALTEGLSEIPAIPAAVRQHWRAEAARLAPDCLHAILASRDPVTAARIDPTDPQRIVRALEVLEATGRPLAEWQAGPRKPLIAPGSWAGLVLAPDREALRARIDLRFERMIRGGALEEVRLLAALGLDPGLPAMRALGVAPLMAHLKGEMRLSAAIARGQAHTRQYAKRQSTWFRHQLNGPWQTLDPAANPDVRAILAAIRGHHK